MTGSDLFLFLLPLWALMSVTSDFLASIKWLSHFANGRYSIYDRYGHFYCNKGVAKFCPGYKTPCHKNIFISCSE